MMQSLSIRTFGFKGTYISSAILQQSYLMKKLESQEFAPEDDPKSNRQITPVPAPKSDTYVRKRNRPGLGQYVLNSKCCHNYLLFIAIICQICLIAYLIYYINSEDASSSSPALRYSIQADNISHQKQLNTLITSNASSTSSHVQQSKETSPHESNTRIQPQSSATLSTQQQSIKNEGPQNNWPSYMSDYNISGHLNLWDMNPQQKKLLLDKYSKLPMSSKIMMNEGFTDINLGKQAELQEYQKKFESEAEVVDWDSIKLSAQQQESLSSEYQRMIASRRQNLRNIIKRYQARFLGKVGYLDANRKITYEVFFNSLEYQKFTGEDISNREDLTKIYQQQKQYYQRVHNVHKYPNEIHACVVAPTYMNNKDYRFAWHIQSLAQQDYTNYRVIIIDDLSKDGTADRIAKHLKWRGVPKDKFILLKNKVHRTALENIYYATNKYCDYNQIAFIVDGDDQLVGTQVFRLYNAIYQQKKLYVLYSNFLSYNGRNTYDPISIGISENYPDHIIQSAKYREYRHSYSHLRTMMTDLFLFEKAGSLQDQKGNFYWTLYDNAIYYPALEMSCGRVEYLPDLKYWYSANTGMNDWLSSRKKEYGEVVKHIGLKQKRYHCIDNVFQVIQETLKK